MKSDLRRSKREEDLIHISVTVQNGVTGDILAGPFPGKILNISRHGACLLMTQVIWETFHIFHLSRDSDSSFILVNINMPPEIKNFSIPARPIWMSLLKHKKIRAFKMGVEFMINPEGEQIKALMSVMKIEHNKRKLSTTMQNLYEDL